jgi:hypothetical protein
MSKQQGRVGLPAATGNASSRNSILPASIVFPVPGVLAAESFRNELIDRFEDQDETVRRSERLARAISPSRLGGFPLAGTGIGWP